MHSVIYFSNSYETDEPVLWCIGKLKFLNGNI